MGVHQIAFADSYGVYDDEMVFDASVRGDGFEVVGRDDAGAAAFHLFEEVAALYVAEEEQAFDGANVGAGGDHVDGDGDAGIVAVAERGEMGFGSGAGAFVADFLDFGAVFPFFCGDYAGDAAAIGDFLGEIIALAEFLAEDLDDIFGVAVVLGKNESFGNVGAAGENFGEELFLESFDDGADLVFGDYVAVELGCGVGVVLVEAFPADFASFAVALVDVEAGFDGGAVFGDVGADAVDVEADVYAIGDGLLVVVLHDEVLVEEAEGLFG